MALLAALVLLNGGAARAAEASFVDATEEAGITYRHQPLSDTIGSGMHGGGSVGDFNNDGWPDLYCVNGGGDPDSVYINNGDGTFTDQALSWRIYELYRGVGSAAADFDGDGWVDIFVASHGARGDFPRNGEQRLYRNNGDGTFSNVAENLGVERTSPLPDGYGVTWADYDLDGDLDLWVGGWSIVGPNDLSIGSRLFENRAGTFHDVTLAAGLVDGKVRGFGSVFADMDGDRFPELLIAGDFGTSRYYRNNQDGTFSVLMPLEAPVELVHGGMGIALGDFDGDLRQDWFVTAIFPAWHLEGAPGNRLYLNRSAAPGEHLLRAVGPPSVLLDGGWGWGTAALDVDHDGWLDLVETNGWDVCDDLTGECFDNEQSYLFRNLAGGAFEEVAFAAGLAEPIEGRGLVHFDYDRDGDLDLVIFENRGPLRLYRNELSGEATNWLKVYLEHGESTTVAPHGIGSTVTVVAGGRAQTRLIHSGGGYLGNSELMAHFGLGAVESVDQLIVDWSDGGRTVLDDVAANQELRLSPDQLIVEHR